MSEKGHIVNHFAEGSVTMQAGSTMNGDVYITGPIYQGVPPQSVSSGGEVSDGMDERIRLAIEALYDCKDEDGKNIFCEKSQWYAVYRVLKEYMNYPEKMSDFVNLINERRWAEREPRCTYTAMKEASKKSLLLTKSCNMWKMYKNTNESHRKQCVIAEKFMAFLELS